MLSIDDKAVEFVDAKDAQGNILQSKTFDVGEDVEVVSEDGTKSLAPDGEHEIELTDSEGNKVVIRIETKDGKIASRENVEEASPADLEKTDEEVVDKKAAVEEHMADATTVEAHPLPNTTDEDPRNSLGEDTDESKDPLITLSYRIDEMEAKMKDMMEKFTSAFPEEGQKVSSLEPSPMEMAKKEDEDLPKLDGAPLEPNTKFSALENSKNYGKKAESSQATFLSKLYN